MSEDYHWDDNETMTADEVNISRLCRSLRKLQDRSYGKTVIV